MRQELENAERLIRELRAFIVHCGWSGNAPDLVVEGVVSVLMRYLATGRPPCALVEEALSLPSLQPARSDSEEGVILNTLAFLFDDQLLIKSRERLTHPAANLTS